ncbi:MAG: DUF4476 domain-containing protein [Ferruginibacter sp.]
MKPSLILIFLAFCFQNVYAQQNRFVYIQTENKQAFYVRIDNILYSSSRSGYLIIPKLKDGIIHSQIGFPKDEWPVQTAIITLKGKDAGFLLKYFSDKGWGLFNLQTLDVVMAKTSSERQPVSEKNEDSFTQVLSEVVNTPDLGKKPVIEVPISEPVKITPEPQSKETVIRDVEIKTAPGQHLTEAVNGETAIKLLYNETNESGRDMIFIDGGDTIRVHIAGNIKPAEPMVREIKPDKTNEAQPKFLDIEIAPQSVKDSFVTSGKVAIQSHEKITPSSTSMINSDCKVNAGEEDFTKLRKKMASGDKDDDMISAAKKAFKSKCYSTNQIKNLGVLFLTDDGRYRFFDLAYPHVYDSSNFATLQQQLSDPYFITRFQAMIRR